VNQQRSVNGFDYVFVRVRRSRHSLLQTAHLCTANDSRNTKKLKNALFNFSSRDHSPHICLTSYPSNPPLNFSRREANTFRSKVKQSVCPELVERVQVTRASIGVLYLFFLSHERAYRLVVFSLLLPSFRLIPLYYTSLHLSCNATSVSTLIPRFSGQCPVFRWIVKVATGIFPMRLSTYHTLSKHHSSRRTPAASLLL
jgi:hypothetical protein